MYKQCLLAGALTLGTATAAVAEDIVFADANVKALCVANWDTDNDGELSVDEAAAVASLGSVFREQAGIGSFPELCHFTGLTAIGDYAFYKSGISGELRIPGNVKSIGDYAFNGCSRLTAVVLDEGVETVGWHAFSGPISTLSLPTSLTYMSSMAIDPYVSADPLAGIFLPKGDLTVVAHAPTPTAINSHAFYYVFSAGHLVVPAGAVEAYKAAAGWSHFGEYLETGDVNGDGSIDIADVACLIACLTGNAPSAFRQQAADFNGDGSIDSGDLELLAQYVLQ